MPSKDDSVERLSDELFILVEKAQGFAFISDSEGAGMTQAQFFERVRGRLNWSEKSCELIRKFLKKYGELSI
jgi:hypothetical protein